MAVLQGLRQALFGHKLDAFDPRTRRHVVLVAFFVGGGTYTGIEAVSNNVNILAEPRVRTGHWTMAYMALSLAFTAGGIIVLYLLWQVQP